MEKQEDHKELISEKAEERKIPVFTVLKNNAILKNIFLLDNPAISEESEKDLEEILVVGRHPDCNITLEHPSISRFHLRIHSNPSSQSLSIVDLSSVHGTWIAGKKIEPGVRVKLQEGDTMKLGGSSRVYRLHWIPLSCAYDMENPFLPPIQESESVKEGEGEGHQVEDGFLHEHDDSLTKSDESGCTDALTKSDESGCTDALHSDTDVPTMKSLTPSPAPLSKNINSPISNEEKVECQTENAGLTSLGSQQRSALNIWSRRGKASSVLIQTSRDAKKSARVSFCSEIKSEIIADIDIQSFSKGLFQSGDMGEKMFTPDKENSALSSLLGSLKATNEFNLKSGSTMKSSLLNVDKVDEIVVPDQENVTMKTIQTGEVAKKSSSVSFGSEIKSEDNADNDIQLFSKDDFQCVDMGEKVFTPDKENSPTSSLLGSLKLTDEFDLKSGSTMKSSLLNVDEIVAPDQENVTMKIIQTGKVAKKSSRVSFGSEIKPEDNADNDIQSFSKDLFQSGDMGEKVFTPDKENSPTSSLPLGSTMKSSLLNVDEVDEIFAPDKENVTMNIQLLSGGADEETFTPDKQMLTPNKENQSPSSVPVRFLLDLESAVKSSVGEDGKIAVPAPPSGYVDEEEMSALDKGNLTAASFPLSSLKNTDEFDLESGLTLKSSLANVDEVDEAVTPNKENITSNVHFPSEDEEEMFTPCKENCIPSSVLRSSLKKTGEVDLKSRSTMKPWTPNMDEGDDEIVTPNKENVALRTHLLRSIKQKGKLENPFPLKNVVDPRIHNDESKLFSLGNDNCDDEIFTPDKENMTPNTHFLWSMNKIGKYRETKNHTGKANEDDSLLSMNKLGKLEETISSNIVNPPHQYEGMSVEKANHNEEVLQEQILTCVIASNQKEKGLNLQSTQKGNMHRVVPLQSVSANSRSKTESNYSKQDVHPFSEKIVREENKRWCMVVDTTSLLNKESRKALQLLQGLKRTSLIVPRIVIRELDCMKRRPPGFFRRTTEVTSALEWVEDCMINTKWWIHVQSSEEEASGIPPTPPAATTPASLFSFDSLFDIVSPTAEDHILEYALSLRKINSGQQLVLLSDDVTLKIKSMAEGLLCETASDFRESLVNPFSERFLWTESSPRGTAWSSSANDVVLKETYYHHGLKKPSRLGESARGLKLILLHNSRYRQLIH